MVWVKRGFMDDMPTRRSRIGCASPEASPARPGGRAAAPGEAAAARQSETDFLTQTNPWSKYVEKRVRLDRARKEAEARYRTVHRAYEGDNAAAAFPHI